MKRNTDPSFKGLQAIKDRQAETLADFERAAAAGDWDSIHSDHYDWWMFPTDEPSGWGLAWTVYDGDVAELKQDAEYLRRYLRGVELLATAWGWDLRGACPLEETAPDQRWQHWPIRLYKAARSTRLFGYPAEFTSLKEYGRRLIAAGERFHYHRDLSWLFLEG
jgi:hypothetical protein